MNPEFQEAQEAFCRGNCGGFEDTVGGCTG
jgi:hypothetical protein